MNLTDRQKEILLAVVDAYTHGCRSVGSNTLVDKYNLNISSATVRSVMAQLMKEGLLTQDYVSSGRVPTDIAFRYYIDTTLQDSMLDSLTLVEIRQGIYSVRFDQKKLVKTILNLLTSINNVASFVIDDDMVRHYGVSSLMNYEELRQIDLLRRLLDVLEDENLLKKVFSNHQSNVDDVKILIGGEIGIDDLQELVMLFIEVPFMAGRKGTVGVVGPRRLDYATVIPSLRAVRESLDECTRHWQ